MEGRDTGEIILYMGGYWDIAIVDEDLVQVWKHGRKYITRRYSSCTHRKKIIQEWQDEMNEVVEISIIPDLLNEWNGEIGNNGNVEYRGRVREMRGASVVLEQEM